MKAKCLKAKKLKIICKFVEKESGVVLKRLYFHRVLRIATVP